jgi:hypothetical protein
LNKICNQYFKILKRLEIYIGKWPSSPYKKAVGTFLPQQGARALSSLMNSLKSVYISTEQQCMLFDSMVGSVLSYASEICGFHRAHDIEVIHSNDTLDASRDIQT